LFGGIEIFSYIVYLALQFQLYLFYSNVFITKTEKLKVSISLSAILTLSFPSKFLTFYIVFIELSFARTAINLEEDGYKTNFLFNGSTI